MAHAFTICKDHINLTNMFIIIIFFLVNLTNMLIIDFIAQVIDVTIKIWEEDRMRDKKVLHMSNSLIFIWLHYDNNHINSINIRPHYI